MSALSSLAFLLAGLTGLSLEMTTSQSAVLVGEPIRVVVRWKATADLASVEVEDPTFVSQTLQFVVDDGTGPRRYKEHSRSRVEMISVGGPLAKGKEVIGNYVLLNGGYLSPGVARAAASFLFPVAGQYSMKAVYVERGTQNVLAESNAVTFTVTAPAADETAVLDILRSEPRLFDGGGDLARLKALMEAHPQSRYLRRAKVSLFERRAAALQNRRDPDTGQSLWRLDDAALFAFRATQYRAMADDLLGDGDWGPFEEERLNMAMLYAQAAGAQSLVEQARNELLQRFPTSQAVAGIRERDALLAEAAIEDRETDDTQPPSTDKTPPTLVVSASPAQLWPPNHKLVPVTIAVTVSDNVDPNPSVKLVSITCDDGCDLGNDAIGAALNTDDRQFQLRAERSGVGAGRTYTITYIARDASGNTATKTTTVTVPHDQGKK